MSRDDLPPLALYLHFPWCVRKCPYCDFNSHTLRETLPEQRYVEALLADLATQAPRAAGRRVHSIFLGGGTPSLFAPDALGRLFAGIADLLSVAADVEVTLEANPATVERGRFAEYRAAGINRVSLGAQSFNSETLKVLGRIHQPTDVLRAAAELHAADLANFNLDLMYALPGQTLAGALSDVTSALTLDPAHVSHYQLTLEPGTVFAARPPPLPDEDLAWSMQVESQALLAAHGFEQYEISAYARVGRRCGHNLNYWRFGDYLGAGAGAHGKLTRSSPAAGLAIERSTHLREPRRYFPAAADGPQWRPLPADDLPFEFMLNALRLKEGFTPELFRSRTGLALDGVAVQLAKLAGLGLVESGGGTWRATPRGFQHLNEVVGSFLADGKSQTAARS
jgi:putative oxygen-independent coproporphyrinogen III oxidase